MQDRSTMTLGGYLYSVFWKFVVGYVWYRSLLFRPLAGLERKASLHILLWLTAAAVLALSLGFRRRKTGGSLQPASFCRLGCTRCWLTQTPSAHAFC